MYQTPNLPLNSTDRKPGGRAVTRPARPPQHVESEDEVRRRVYGLLKTLTKTYPALIWRFDYSGSHIPDDETRAKIHALNRRGFPDLVIYHLGRVCFLELKASNIPAKHLLNPTDDRSRDQLATLQKLQDSGFDAGFAIGYEMAYRKLFSFLDGRLIPLI